jgi:uncharacterized protein
VGISALFAGVAALFLLVAFYSPVFADYPSHRGTALNDFAGVVDRDHAAKIETLSREVLEKTGTSIVVVTMQAIGENEDINRYVNGLYTAWGIGTKGEDRGLLIFLAMEERRVRIETGYGVEGILPDGLVGEILDDYVVPYLQSGEVGRALYNAVYACGAYVAHDAGVELTGVSSSTRTRSAPENGNVNWPGLIFLLIAATVLLGTKQGRRMLPWILLLLLTSGRGGGGMGGGFGGGFGGFGGGMSGGGGAGRGF